MAIAVKFVRNKSPYNAGDLAGFDRGKADSLIRAGIAVEHDLDAQAEAEAKSIAGAKIAAPAAKVVTPPAKPSGKATEPPEPPAA